MRPRPLGPPGFLLALAYATIVIVPTIAAVASGSLGPGAALVTAAGIAALVMLLLQFPTSGRFESVSGRIGLDMTMGFHRIAGMALLGLAFVHVLAVPTRLGVPDASRFLGRLWNALVAPGNLTGLVALVLLLVLVPWAKWARGRFLAYEIWRILHGLGALSAVALALHHAVTRGDAVSGALVGAIVGSLAVVAAGSLAVVYLLRPRLAYRHGFAVETVRRLSPSVVELTALGRPNSGFRFRPGQFAWIAFGGRHTITDHPFSIASAPEDLPRLRFLVREAGDGTRMVSDLAVGTSVAVDGPHGSFVENQSAETVLLIAGGIGIAPILSILGQAALARDPRRFRLLVGARSAADLVAAPDIATAKRSLDLSVSVLVEEGDPPAGGTRGRTSPDAIRAHIAGLELSSLLAFVCGPPAMMDSVVTTLVEAGVPPDRIVTERFDYDAAGDPLSRAVRRRFLAVLAAIAVAVLAVAGLA